MKECKGCQQGLEPLMLDVDGVRCVLSNKPGNWYHAVDDAWWPCDRMRSVFGQIIFNTKHNAIALLHRLVRKSPTLTESDKRTIERALRMLREE